MNDVGRAFCGWSGYESEVEWEKDDGDEETRMHINTEEGMHK